MRDFAIAKSVNQRASRLNVPLSVLVEFTYRCNQQCYFCYNNRQNSAEELTFPEWRGILNQLAGMGCLYLTVSGGEPFSRKNFIPFLKTARAFQFAVSIITNGTYINAETAAKLEEMAVLDVGISFHAIDEVLHDRLAGMAGSFQAAVNALRILRTAGIRTIIKHSVSSENFGQFRKLSEFAQEEDALFEADSIVFPNQGRGISPYSLNLEQQIEFLKFMKVQPGTMNIRNKNDNLHCDAGRSLCGISPYGDVFPCVQLPISLGNLRNGSMKEIWFGKKAEKFRIDEKEINNECLICADNKNCARCPGVSFMETGDWHGKGNSLCQRARAFGEISREKKAARVMV